MPTSADVKRKMRYARFFCAVGMMILITDISFGPVGPSILGMFLLLIGSARYFQVRQKALNAENGVTSRLV